MLSFLLCSPALALPDIDHPLRTGARSPDDAAVIIGIEDYYAIQDVPYATRDAEAFYDLAVYTLGIPSSQVKRLTTGANREKILDAVDAAATQASGRVWVYFAGHGAASPVDGARMVLGVDVQPDAHTFQARSVRLDELRERAGAGGAEVVLVLDTCYTGVGREGKALMPGSRFAVPSYATDAEAKVVEWTAAGPNQMSGPLEAARHGAFTYLAVGALRGWADGQLSGEPDGTVTLEEAQLFVDEALRSLQFSDQTPALTTKAELDTAFVRSDKLEPRATLGGEPPRDADPEQGSEVDEQQPQAEALTSEVLDALLRNSLDVKKCFFDEMRRAGRLPGKVVVQLSVEADGQVSSAGPVGEHAEGELADCLGAALRKVEFPATGAKLRLKYPFILN